MGDNLNPKELLDNFKMMLFGNESLTNNEHLILNHDLPIGCIVSKRYIVSDNQDLLICDGRKINENDYPELYNILKKYYAVNGIVYLPVLISSEE